MNGSGRGDVRFVVATKNSKFDLLQLVQFSPSLDLSLYDVINECKNNTPRIQFSTSRQIPSVYDDSDVSFKRDFRINLKFFSTPVVV